MRPTPLSLPLHRGLNLSQVPIVASLKKACLLQWWQRHESRQAAWLLLGPWLLLPKIVVEGALKQCMLLRVHRLMLIDQGTMPAPSALIGHPMRPKAAKSSLQPVLPYCADLVRLALLLGERLMRKDGQRRPRRSA